MQPCRNLAPRGREPSGCDRHYPNSEPRLPDYCYHGSRQPSRILAQKEFYPKRPKGETSERKSRWSQYDRGGTIQEWDTHPDAIYEGSSGELLAIKKIQSGKYIVVAYKEVSKTDGFVITAFLTSKMRQFERRKKVWSRQK